MSIYSIILLAALIAGSQQQTFNNLYEIRQDWKRVVTPFTSTCMCQTGLSKELMDGFFDRGEIPSEPCFKCSLKCWAQSLQFLSTSGYLDTKKFSETIAGVDLPIANYCGVIKHDDICEMSYQILLCFYPILEGRTPYPGNPKDSFLFAQLLQKTYK